MKEMEAIVESEFAEVFVPLVMGLATYQDICVVQKAKKDWKPCDLKPFEVTTDCLQVFFYSKRDSNLKAPFTFKGPPIPPL